MKADKRTLKKCLRETNQPRIFYDFLKYAQSLEFDEAPDYDTCISMFKHAATAQYHYLELSKILVKDKPVNSDE